METPAPENPGTEDPGAENPEPGGHGPEGSGSSPEVRRGVFGRFLDFVEWLGNLLPHPVTLFAIFCVAIVVISGIGGAMAWAVKDPRPPGFEPGPLQTVFREWLIWLLDLLGLEIQFVDPEGIKGRSADGIIRAKSLMTPDGLRWMVSSLVTNFTGFKPLGTVLVALLGVGVAESSGMLTAAIRGLVLRAPKSLVTVTVVFAGVLSNTASEMGYVLLVPLAAVMFRALGRHPIAGMAAAFAGVSGGYSANLLIGTVDPLLSGITEKAAQIIDPSYTVHPAINYYFMATSTFLITLLGSLVTMFIVEPKLGKWDSKHAQAGAIEDESFGPLSDIEKSGLKWAGASALVLIGLLAWTIVPENGILRDPETGAVLKSPFFTGIVAMIFVLFFVPGVVYGKVTGSMKNDRDVIDGMAKSMSTMGLYIVLVFFAAQFVEFFGWTNLGQLLAVVGADFLQETGLTGPLVFIPFILMCCFVNLMLGSASAQWAVTAPIFVPMLMLTGYSPEVIQAAYRIGDSTTNIITPMMSYFGLILAFAVRYDRRLGIGTVVATMLPYSIVFFIGWSILFYLFVFVFDIPVGPGSPTYYTPPGQ